MGLIDDDAAEALRLATVAPERATTLALEVERAAVRAGADAARSVAARARGVAALQLRDLPAASRALRAAIRAGERAGIPRLAGEARMTLAAVLGVRGLPDRAMAEIDAALDSLDGLAAARARTQRAAILQVRGRHGEALDELRRAVPVLRRHGDVEWQVRALSNRGLLLFGRRAFAQAQADLEAALELCRTNGLDLPAAYAEHNLGYVLAGRGDLAAALAHFDSAETRYTALGIELGELWLDRAGVLLSLRLVAEARAAAESAVRIHVEQRHEMFVPESHLMLSTVALVGGDVHVAFASAEAATREFRHLRRPEGLALARYARLQAVVARDGDVGDPGLARRSAAELAAAGWLQPALEARLLAGRLELDRGRPAAARRDLGLAAGARRSGPADARARAWYAEAVLREASGRRRGALAALSTGLRIVEDHQQTLGATELRAHVSLHGGTLARAGLRLAVAGGDPRGALGWAERGRARAILLRSPAAPADAALAGDLADLRSTMTEIAEARAARRPAAALVARQVALEHAVAARTRAVSGPRGPGGAAGRRGAGRSGGAEATGSSGAAGGTGSSGGTGGSGGPAGDAAPPDRPGTGRRGGPDVAELAAALDEAGSDGAALVEYLVVDDALSAVTVAGGRVRLHHLGPFGPVRDDLEHLAFSLARLADPHVGSASGLAARAVLTRTADRLDALLFAPLRRVLGDRALVIAPTGDLQSLPWAVLPSCAGRAVTVSPSAAVWLRARRPRGSSGAVVVVAGPGLPGAAAEALAVTALYAPDSRSPDRTRVATITGAAATVADVCAALDGARLAHVAAHGRLRADNPLFSSLLLADGPLVIYDLERLRVAPEHVVLAACETARSAVLAGEETVGLAVALLQQGTGALVAPLLAVPDAHTEPLMLAYHQRCIAGSSPAEALAATQAAMRRDVRGGDPSAAVASAFICLGDGLRTPAGAGVSRRDPGTS